jgi:origin recognition complex subunit 3
LQPFFVLHKAAAGASVTTSRPRPRINISQPSSPNPKSANRPRVEDEDDDERDMEQYEQLRLEAFHYTWSKIQFTINVCLFLPDHYPHALVMGAISHIGIASFCFQEVLRGINLKLFDQVLRWVQESFSMVRSVMRPCPAEIQQPYPLLTDVICRKIPTAFVLTSEHITAIKFLTNCFLLVMNRLI